MHRLQIALTKGRLQDKSVELFEKSGIDCTPIRDPGRRLIRCLTTPWMLSSPKRPM